MKTTIRDLYEKTKNRLCLDERNPLFSFSKIFISVHSGAMYMAYKMIDQGIDQFFPDTSSESGVLRWANIFMIERIRATFAEVEAEFTPSQNNPISFTDDIYIRSHNSIEYEFIEETGVNRARFLCKKDGALEELVSGDVVFLGETHRDINTEAKVLSFKKGTDTESLESLKNRVIYRFQNPPMGGSESDYINWLKELAGITDVYVRPFLGGVNIYFLCKNRLTPLPTDKELIDARIHINKVRPVTAVVNILGVTEAKNQIKIKTTPEIRTAIKLEELNKMFKLFLIKRARPGLGLRLIDVQQFFGEYVGLYGVGQLESIDFRVSESEIVTQVEFI